MIKSFAEPDARGLWESGTSRRLPASLRRSAFKKLAVLNAALTLDNLRVPPGNRLEALKGDRTGQYNIRINDRYRVCFQWRDGHAFNVEIVDYH
jgi:proteic killer suppression protein